MLPKSCLQLTTLSPVSKTTQLKQLILATKYQFSSSISRIISTSANVSYSQIPTAKRRVRVTGNCKIFRFYTSQTARLAMTEEIKDPKILLDASALLLLSGSVAAKEEPQEPEKKATELPVSPSSNPGPAVAALSMPKEGKEDHSLKAMVAAAALAAAASTPLPLSKFQEEKKKLEVPFRKRASSHGDKKDLLATNKSDEEATPNYAIDPDAGIIDCICKLNEDDGFTIQCERCFRWQHAMCFDISKENVPDIYYCERCDPKTFKAKNINVKDARERQWRVLNGGGHGSNEGKRKAEEDSSEEETKKRRANPKPATEADEVKEEEVVKEKPEEKKDKTKAKRKKEEFDDHTNEELIHRIESAKDEYYYVVYDNLKTLEYGSKAVEVYFKQVLPKIYSRVEFSPEKMSELLAESKIYVKNILLTDTHSSSHYKFSGLSNLGLYTENAISDGSYVQEFFGEVEYQESYLKNPINQFKHWGVPKSYYYFVKYDEDSGAKYFDKSNENKQFIPLCLNCKNSGNVTRFIRKSCYPNCEIEVVLVDGEIKLYLKAIKSIESHEELTVGWEFEFNDLWGKLYPTKSSTSDDNVKSNFNNKLTNNEKIQLINQVEFILSQYKCGCYSVSSNVNNSKCKLLRIKKMGSYFYRSSRKGSKLAKIESKNPNSGVQLISSRLELRDKVFEAQEKREVVVVKSQAEDVEDKEDVVIKHPKKGIISKAINYSIINSRAQLAKAIIANCLSIPINIKTGQEVEVEEKLAEKEVEKDENKKIKKLSFADFLKNRPLK